MSYVIFVIILKIKKMIMIIILKTATRVLVVNA